MAAANTNNSDYWSGKSRSFYSYPRRSPYADWFLSHCGIQPGESVLDMGCGSGTLCIPLADEGHRVHCADFSSGMLGKVDEVIAREGLEELLSTQLLAWEDDWDLAGVPLCDMAIASRCLFGYEPSAAVAKLSSRARKRCALSLSLNAALFQKHGSPYDIGSQRSCEDYFAAMLEALKNQGYQPTLDYLEDEDGSRNWVLISWKTEDAKAAARPEQPRA